jgi:hypothetical protein
MHHPHHAPTGTRRCTGRAVRGARACRGGRVSSAPEPPSLRLYSTMPTALWWVLGRLLGRGAKGFWPHVVRTVVTTGGSSMVFKAGARVTTLPASASASSPTVGALPVTPSRRLLRMTIWCVCASAWMYAMHECMYVMHVYVYVYG